MTSVSISVAFDHRALDLFCYYYKVQEPCPKILFNKRIKVRGIKIRLDILSPFKSVQC
jgi:hypothetical protein